MQANEAIVRCKHFKQRQGQFNIQGSTSEAKSVRCAKPCPVQIMSSYSKRTHPNCIWNTILWFKTPLTSVLVVLNIPSCFLSHISKIESLQNRFLNNVECLF